MTPNEFEEFQSNINKMNKREALKSKEQTFIEALAEGHRLLIEEEAYKKLSAPVPSKIKDTPKPSGETTEKNIYKRAHKLLLDKWLKNPKTTWLAKEAMAMEAGTIPKDYHYDSFIQEVAILGDSL